MVAGGVDEARAGDGRDIRFLLLPRKRRGGEASFRARGLPVDGTINGRDTGLSSGSETSRYPGAYICLTREDGSARARKL